jgi:hypothetical protein
VFVITADENTGQARAGGQGVIGKTPGELIGEA